MYLERFCWKNGTKKANYFQLIVFLILFLPGFEG